VNTKGKWEIKPIINKEHIVESYEVCVGQETIATVANWVNASEESKANAVLIGNAPEMRDVLASILNYFDRGKPEKVMKIPWSLLEKAKELTQLGGA
jgi:hypothetical protein